jgi:predicted nucleotidyltransferase
MISAERRHAADDLVVRAIRWAASQDDILALLMLGSWARGNPRMDSDVDLIVLTDQVERYLDGEELIRWSGAVRVIREQNWGAIEERRLSLPSGLEVEIGLGSPSWAAVAPVDPGTREVVADGARILYDPDGLLAALVATFLSS